MSQKIKAYGYTAQTKRNLVINAAINSEENTDEVMVAFTNHSADFGIPWNMMSNTQRNLRRKEMRQNNIANHVN